MRMVGALLVVGLAGVPAAASAGPPDRGTSSYVSLECETGGDIVSLYADTNEFGAFADLYVEADGGSYFGFSDDASYDGTTLVATVPLESEDGSEVAPALVDATFTAVGEPEVFEDRFREGNRQVRISSSVVDADVAGSLVIDGVVDVDLADCDASLVEETFFATNPATEIYRSDGFFLDCGVSGAAGDGSLYVDEFDGTSFLDVFLFGRGYGVTEDVVFTDTEVSGAVVLEDGSTAVVDASLTSLGVESFREQSPRATVRGTEEFFEVEGTIAVEGATSDLVDCFAVRYDVFERFTNAGRGGGGRPPSNDGPGGAQVIEVPGEAVTSNTGASSEPEAECIDEFGLLPITNTVWYSFVGTGDTVTVDTGGSTFDTIVGVYDADLSNLVCNDDTDAGLQAAVTIDTVAGQTYLVQAGGFGGDTGTLVVTVD